MTARSAPTDHPPTPAHDHPARGAVGHPAGTRATPDATRRLTGTALITSAVTTTLVGFFAAAPDLNPFLAEGNALGRALLPGPVLTWTLLAVALLGLATATAALLRPRSGDAGRLVAPVAALQVVAFGFLAQGAQTLSAAGYLMSLAVPVLVVWMAVQVFRTRPGWRIPIALGGVLAVVGIVVARDAFATQLGGVMSGFARERWGLLGVVIPLATATAWAGLALLRAWRRGSLHRATAWVTRHRRLFTVLAALGPLPYALARLTWLTPWAMFGGEGVPLSVKIQGLALSSGAWLGFFLTLGLILPWGERFPRWFPRRAGQPVPPAAAIIPGGIVAVMLSGAAIPLLLMMGASGAVLFPAWFWGPMLALAVWGYAGHRAGIDVSR
ncbi:hypothetical protein Bcav_4205 [Beutenbergia cavernae DSM 12333]|uniref:Uncharacterized protein n=1 Tax=Beutenbergia cavernae (strain ATCC BAA-8 / DSM 12333 / CCUG 43141 / JCM 11478 / NBRC 16432 / NCIMB 13614 / HKI 0122) TaxID=471853 RepID=C5C6L9_BEUC1|nr:hypothetical protein [Beutenbergia cavernae]ACQ82443.1 hypothetical protein Bcav_4205 [Beutenbergia cavernae DSM 12333]